MVDQRPADQMNFLAKLSDAFKSADGRGKSGLMFVRCVESGLQTRAADAIEETFPRISWERLDLTQPEIWNRLREIVNAQPTPGPPRGVLVYGFPRDAEGKPERLALKELARIQSWFLRRGNISVFLTLPSEVEGVMRDMETLWTGRAAYLAWPERKTPLPDRDPDEEEATALAAAAAADRRETAAQLESADGQEVLLAAATLFQNGYIDHAGGHAVQALSSFQAIHDHQGAGEAQHLLGMIAERRGDPASALGWYEKSLEAYRRSDGTELERAIVEEHMANLHFDRGDLDSALTLFRRALEKDEKRQDSGRMAAGYRHIAIVLERVEKLPLAESFLRRALELEDEQDNRRGVARCHLHLGRIHYQLGSFSEGGDHLREAEALCKEFDDKSGLSSVLHEKGNADLDQGLYPEAIKNYQQALTIDEMLGNRRSLARGHAQLGHAYAEAGKRTDSLRHLLIAHQSVSLLGTALAKAVMERIREIRRQLDKEVYQSVADEAAEEIGRLQSLSPNNAHDAEPA